MSLTPEQLMIPRVMCIGTEEGTPNDTSGNFFSGDILTLNVTRFGYKRWVSKLLKHTVLFDENNLEKFPHLFRPMPWWESRKLEEMPEYVKVKNKVFKVIKYNLTFGEFLPEKAKYMKRLDGTLPATREEYDQFLKQKEG